MATEALASSQRQKAGKAELQRRNMWGREGEAKWNEEVVILPKGETGRVLLLSLRSGNDEQGGTDRSANRGGGADKPEVTESGHWKQGVHQRDILVGASRRAVAPMA